MSIEIRNLSKSYGRKVVLKDVNLSIQQGMYGLLGRNGAGKTTLMKIIVTLAQASEGDILIDDIPISDVKRLRTIIGYLPQNFSMYPEMRVCETLQYLGALAGISKNEISKRIHELLIAVNLENEMNVKVRDLSGGMRQRLGIAQALLNNPRVLVVDEPTAGLDPEERIRFRNLLCEVSENKMVILSTHIAQDIENTCQNVAVLNSGEIVYNGNLNKLIQMAKDKVYEVSISREEVTRLKREKTVLAIQGENNGKLVQCRILSDVEPAGNYKKCPPNLEDGYMQIIREKVVK